MSDSGERWVPVVGWVGLYEVSSQGRVRSVDKTTRHGHKFRGRMLSISDDGNGYPRVGLSIDGRTVSARVHVLVAKAFIGAGPAGTEVCHRDDVKTNNTPENLYWGSRSDNMRDLVRNGGHPQASKPECKYGHAFSPENTRVDGNGYRWCLACQSERYAAWKEGRQRG